MNITIAKAASGNGGLSNQTINVDQSHKYIYFAIASSDAGGYGTHNFNWAGDGTVTTLPDSGTAGTTSATAWRHYSYLIEKPSKGKITISSAYYYWYNLLYID